MVSKRTGWLIFTLVILLLAPVLLWLSVYFDDQALQGLRIEGVEIAGSGPIENLLDEQAQVWADTLIVVEIGQFTIQKMRRELGARLEIEPMVKRALAPGHSGNPITDLRKWWAARRGKLDISWAPSIDLEMLGKFVERERERLELPPKVGISDGQGWSIPGRDGVTLDYHTTVTKIKHALSHHKTFVELTLQTASAPDPIIIGSPDGMLFDDKDEKDATTIPGSSMIETAPLPREYEKIQYLPSSGDDCYEKPPYRPFCDGPRMVPKPHGIAMALASRLGLGTIATVRQLLSIGPTQAWIRAVGGLAAAGSIPWPVTNGRPGRGFGYVRKRKEVRNRLHKGVDFVAPKGSQIRAVNPGIVAYSDNGIRGYGNLLIIIHADGSTTLSAHCYRIFVFAGQRVLSGQVVAEIGSTGMSLGPHLHFEYHVAGKPIVPPLFTKPKFPGSRP